MLRWRYKLGRLANGAEADKGSVAHLSEHEGAGKALCGNKPGRRSVGWSDAVPDPSTFKRCPRCLRKSGLLGPVDAKARAKP